MQRRAIACAALAAAAALVLVTAAMAETEVRVLRDLPVEGVPLDVALTSDGSQIFVLTEGGRLLIYGPDGSLRDRVELGGDADSIALSPRGDGLVVSSRTGKTARVLLLETIREVRTEGSPSRGPADAPVTVAVFSDFQ